MGSRWLRRMLKIARSIVLEIIRQVTEQVNIIETIVKHPIQRHLNRVDEIWRSQGANEFKRTLSEDALPQLDRITGNISQHVKNVQTAVQIIDDADMRARTEVQRLTDMIEQI